MRYPALLFAACCVFAVCPLRGADAPPQELADSVKNADGVVVAKIVRKSESELLPIVRMAEVGTKALVTETLMGPELKGQEMILVIDPRLIEKDRSYVIFFKPAGSGYSVTIGAKGLAATPQNVEMVRKEIAAQGKRASAAVAVRMSQSSGRMRIEDARVTRLIIAVDGKFERTVRARKDDALLERSTGAIPADELADLTAKLTHAGAGPGAEDAGFVTIEFLNDKGKLEQREYSMPGAAPCAGLVATMNALAAKYADAAPAALPRPVTEGGKPLMDALKDRRSAREFAPKKLSGQTLSDLLWAAWGVNRSDGRRTAPSAVNWQEIDVYVCTAEGASLFDAKEHALKPIVAEDLRALTGTQGFVKDAPVNLVYVADFSKMKMDGVSQEVKTNWAYADAAFISQNVYLFCSSEGLSTVVRALIDRPTLAKALKLRADQSIILAQSVGYPKP